MMEILREFNFAFRLIRQRLGFNLICIFVISLGFAISIPLYSIVRSIVYPSFPAVDSDRLIIINQQDSRTNRGMTTNSFDAYQLNTIRENASSFESINGLYESSAIFADGLTPESFFGAIIEAEGLTMMGVQPLLGRSLLASDERAGAESVVLIAEHVWQNYYAADPEIVGRVAEINGQAHSIVGVMPEGIEHPQASDFWMPLNISLTAQPGDGRNIGLFGVLKRGVRRGEASREVGRLVESMSEDYADAYPYRTADVIPYSQGWINSFANFQAAGILSVCIFLLVFLNVSNLLLIRANQRVGELAIRMAVGAHKLVLVRHVLFESFLVCALGAVLGIIASSWELNFVQYFFTNVFLSGEFAPYWFEFRFNAEIALVSLFMLMTLWLITGLFTAWRVTKGNICTVLGSEGPGKGATSSSRITAILVLLQVVLSFFLLLLSGIYLYSSLQSYRGELIANEDNYLTFSYNSSPERFPERSNQRNFRNSLSELLNGFPEIESVSIASTTPGNRGNNRVSFSLANSGSTGEQQRPLFGEVGIGNNYFDVLELPLLEGRLFDNSDSANSEAVALVDAAFVRWLDLSISPVGEIVYVERSDGTGVEAVRIVGLVPFIDAGSTISNIYRPISQLQPNSTQVIAKIGLSSVSIPQLENKIKLAAATIDRTLPMTGFRKLSEITDSFNSFVQLNAWMFGTPVLGALLLSIVGIYGMISRSIFEQLREIGIRRALGSSNNSITRLFVGRGTVYLLTGATLGGGSAILFMNFVGSAATIGSIWPSLSLVFCGITLLMGAIVGFASYFPVRKALILEPGEALHYE